MTIFPKLIGRLGNQMFIYAKAKSLAEKEGHTLCCMPNIIHKLFLLDDEPGTGGDIVVDGYCQNQESLTYTVSDCKRWFRFRPEWVNRFAGGVFPEVVAHMRRGDYGRVGYTVVSERSYWKAAGQFGHKIERFFTDGPEGEIIQPPTDDEAFRDFYKMTKAKVIFRGNSSFSWWAATLSDALVFSPLIAGCGGGEWDCDFVLGNSPMMANLPGFTDLQLKYQ